MKNEGQFDRIRMDSGQHRRILLIALVLGGMAFVPIALRLSALMVDDYAFYREKALRNQSRSTSVAPDRGTIFDRNMNILAASRGVENVYLDPHELKQAGENPEQIAGALSEILELEPETILQKAGDTRLRYQQIASGIDPEIGARIRTYINEQNISGVHLEPSSRRVYPFGKLAAQVIGFTNASHTGSEGIEAAYDSFLSGSSGRVITTKGNNEMDMPYSLERYLESRGGCDVILTLDTTVQTSLERQMEAAIDRYDVQNGAFGMVMDVNTGEILAMATLGSYDPNNYLEVEDETLTGDALTAARLKQWRNRCISDGYEPGSTFKTITMAAALDCGAIDLNTPFHCSGAEQIPGRAQRLHCWKSAGHGSEQTPQALQNSCNIAFAHIALKLGGQRFYEYVEKFGILEKTGIDLAGESRGVFFDRSLVEDTDKWGTASLTSGSFGQTFKLTPLQLVRAVAAVVNGGRLLEPYMVSQVVAPDGTVVLQQEPTVLRQVIREETSRTMCSLIESVVTEGTAKNARVSGFSIGGKTGTSEKIDVFDENGQRVQDKIVSFVGIAPMDDPQYIVLVALDTPSRQTGLYISGGVMAAPTVGAVMADILPYLGVKQSFDPDAPAGNVVTAPDLTGTTFSEAEKELAALTLTAKQIGSGDVVTAQLPQPGQSVPGGNELLLYFGEEPQIENLTVPDFTGQTRQQANDSGGLLGLYVLPRGSDDPFASASHQEPEPGAQVPAGSTVTITFTEPRAVD